MTQQPSRNVGPDRADETEQSPAGAIFPVGPLVSVECCLHSKDTVCILRLYRL